MAIPPSALSAKPQQQGPDKTPPGTSRPENAAQKKPESSISVEAPVVNVDAVVTDQAGDIITGLKKENFRILEDGADQTITNFTPSDAPITIVVLMEFSQIAYNGSSTMRHRTRRLSSEFLDSLGPKDYVALVTFDMKSRIEQDFTQNKDEVKGAIAHLFFPDSMNPMCSTRFMTLSTASRM